MSATVSDAPPEPTDAEGLGRAADRDGRDLPWWALFIAVVFAVLGFVAPALWLFAFATFAVWAAGFRYRAATDAHWYVW